MQRKKDFGAMDARHGQTTSAATQALRNRSGNPSSIPLGDLQPNPDNPRYDYDDPETQELSSTLRTVGQLQAATVIPRENYLAAYSNRLDRVGPEPWVVIIGNRRLAASRLAGRPSLDVRVNRELMTADAIEDLILIENLQRTDLPPLLEAAHLQRRLSRPGQSTRTVGEAIGKSHTYVKQRVDLLRLIPQLQELLRSGALDIKTARQLGTRSEEEQRSVLDTGAPYLLPRAAPSDATSTPTRGGNPVSTDGAPSNTEATGPVANVAVATEPTSAVNGVSSRAAIAPQPGSEAVEAHQSDAHANATEAGAGEEASSAGATESAHAPATHPTAPEADAVATARVAIAASLRAALLELDRVLPAVASAAVHRTFADARRSVGSALRQVTDAG